jgi:hypothetical protein
VRVAETVEMDVVVTLTDVNEDAIEEAAIEAVVDGRGKFFGVTDRDVVDIQTV